MPNFLAGLASQTLRTKTGDIARRYYGPAIGNLALSRIPVVGGVLGGLATQTGNRVVNAILSPLQRAIGLGSGSKPKALHTEYASGQANQSKPYGGGTDIVFYMLRADKAGAAANTASSLGALNPLNPGGVANSTKIPGNTIDGLTVTANSLGVGRARLSASSQAGPRVQSIAVASPLVQLAQAKFLRQQLSRTNSVPRTRGLAGPYTGIKMDQTVAPGGSSQNAVSIEPLQQSLVNLTEYVRSDRQLVRSYQASEQYFEDVLHRSFQAMPKMDHPIEMTIAHGEINSLAAGLAFRSGGLRSSVDLIEAINDGRAGFTDGASAAEAERLGPQGLRRRSTK